MRSIVIDVGNTSTGIARFENGRISHITHINGGVRRQPELCARAVRRAAGGKVDGAVLGSVVPRVNTISSALRALMNFAARVRAAS